MRPGWCRGRGNEASPAQLPEVALARGSKDAPTDRICLLGWGVRGIGAVRNTFPVNGRESICGHSMGGHGAFVCALHNPRRYAALSAFASIANPVACPWGEKAFNGYLGEDRSAWADCDASDLIRARGFDLPLLVDQGDADNFLEDGQLRPEALEQACSAAGVDQELRYHAGYGHSYFFIATFIEDHLRWHAAALSRAG